MMHPYDYLYDNEPSIIEQLLREKRQKAPTNLSDHWTLCSEELPKKSKRVLVTTDSGYVDIMEFNIDKGKFFGWDYMAHSVVAWTDAPVPYIGD